MDCAKANTSTFRAAGEQLALPYDRRGSGGGLIVQVIEYADETKPVTYRYSDFDLLHAIARGYLQANEELRTQAENFVASLLEGVGSETIDVTKALTFPVNDAASLLAIAGFHNPIGPYLPFENFYMAEIDGFEITMRPPFSNQHSTH